MEWDVKAKTRMALAGVPRILPEIRQLIEAARQHVAVAANLGMVNLYWNIGIIITRDIQKDEKRAGYGDQLIEELGKRLTSEYGQGFSARNLWDMKRFFAEFQILQAPPAELGMGREQLQPASRTSRIPQAPPADSRGLIEGGRRFKNNFTLKRKTGENPAHSRTTTLVRKGRSIPIPAAPAACGGRREGPGLLTGMDAGVYSAADVARFLGVTISSINRLAVSEESPEFRKYLNAL